SVWITISPSWPGKNVSMPPGHSSVTSTTSASTACGPITCSAVPDSFVLGRVNCGRSSSHLRLARPPTNPSDNDELALSATLNNGLLIVLQGVAQIQRRRQQKHCTGLMCRSQRHRHYQQ